MDEPLDVVDVFTAVRRARAHALKAVLAWMLPMVVVLVLGARGELPWWPVVDYRVEGHVVSTEPADGGTVVTFEAEGEGHLLRWSRWLDDSEWTIGDEIDGWVGEDGRFYMDYGMGFWPQDPMAKTFVLVAAVILVFSARRLLGLLVAMADLNRTGDPPRRAFVALRDPISWRLNWRPLLLVWWEDPLRGGRPSDPDEVFVVDHETSRKFTRSLTLEVWEAWVDTGRYWWTKPRWVAVRAGAIIPHRRSVLAAAPEWAVPSKLRVRGPIPQPAPAPDPRRAPPLREGGTPGNLGLMLLWRAAAVVAVSLLVAAGGSEEVTVVRDQTSLRASGARVADRQVAPEAHERLVDAL